jgi:hypothetical protein
LNVKRERSDECTKMRERKSSRNKNINTTSTESTSLSSSLPLSLCVKQITSYRTRRPYLVRFLLFSDL